MNPLQILVVDDDREWAEDFCANMRSVLPGRLATMGWNSLAIQHAVDQEGADRAVKDKAGDGYDLILLDLVYPQCSSIPLKEELAFQGMKWLPQLRRLQPRAAIVIITSYPYENQLLDVVNAIRDNHADEFVPKTAALDEITGRMFVALTSARRTRALRVLEMEFHRLLRSHAVSVLADDGGRLIEHTISVLRQIARRVESGDPAAIESAPKEILTECRSLKERYVNVTSFFDTLGAQQEGEVDVCELARQMLLLYAWRIEEARAEAKPPKQDGIRATTYESDLRIALHEVLCNAIDSLESSSTPPLDRKVEVEVEKSQRHVVLRVLDNGDGFSDEAIRDMFEPRRTTREDGKHQGLGLYIARHMVQAIGGSIEARNRHEGGAEVILTVPDMGKP
jgi:signal transduction histidine kinase